MFGEDMVFKVVDDVNFAAYDGFDTGVFEGFIEFIGAVHVAVVGDCDGAYAAGLANFCKAGDAGGTVQKAVFRVDM